MKRTWHLGRLWVVCVVVLIASCNRITGPEIGLRNPNPADTLRLGVGQSVEWRGIRIGFFRIAEDSRCPIDVECFWEGDAAAGISIGPGYDMRGPDQTFVLHTSLEPRAGEAWGARVELRKVDPPPVSWQPTPPESYVVTLYVTASS